MNAVSGCHGKREESRTTALGSTHCRRCVWRRWRIHTSMKCWGARSVRIHLGGRISCRIVIAGRLAVRSPPPSRARVDYLARARLLHTASCSTTTTLKLTDTRRTRYTHSNHTFPPSPLFLFFSTSCLTLSNNTYRHKSRHHAAAFFSSSFVIYLSSIHSPSPALPRLPLLEK
jgi:hypothetical protein